MRDLWLSRRLYAVKVASKDVYVMSPGNYAEIVRHTEFVNGSLTNYTCFSATFSQDIGI